MSYCNHTWVEEVYKEYAGYYCNKCNLERNTRVPVKFTNRIQAFESRNYDGSLAGYTKGTEEGDRWLTEEVTVYCDGTKSYKNWW